MICVDYAYKHVSFICDPKGARPHSECEVWVSVEEYTVSYYSILYIVVYCIILQYTVYCSILYHTVYCILWYTVSYYNILYILVYCSIL